MFEGVAANALPRRSFAANGQGAVFGRDFDVLGRDARNIGTQNKPVLFLLQIDRRTPSRAIAHGTLYGIRASEELVDLAVPAIQYGPRLIIHKIRHFALQSISRSILCCPANIGAELAF